jgi:hypothetical protein
MAQRKYRVLVFAGDELVYQSKVKLNHDREELRDAAESFVNDVASSVARWGRGINRVRVHRSPVPSSPLKQKKRRRVRQERSEQP